MDLAGPRCQCRLGFSTFSPSATAAASSPSSADTKISGGQHVAGRQRNSVLIIGQHNRSRFPAVIYDLLAERWGKAAPGQRIAHGFALPRFQTRVAAYQVGANRSKQASLLQSIDLLVALQGGGRVGPR